GVGGAPVRWKGKRTPATSRGTRNPVASRGRRNPGVSRKRNPVASGNPLRSARREGRKIAGANGIARAIEARPHTTGSIDPHARRRGGRDPIDQGHGRRATCSTP